MEIHNILLEHERTRRLVVVWVDHINIFLNWKLHRLKGVSGVHMNVVNPCGV